MGITGLIPFLEKASRRACVSEFSGCTVAIDTYCWLHKGAFACADKLVRGEETNIHIKYCLKYVNMLLSHNIKPILVFDGRHLPAKKDTETKRRESRNISKKRAAELLSLGQIDEARSYMRRAVDITHEMALSLIKECRSMNVDCIVAPYEADAQLAYLNIHNYAHLVITEDSDLILFGCTKVLFKMDLDGKGTLVETVRLPLAMKCPIERYSFDKFRQMCIMSGCDYLASLPGIGLAKARQFVTTTQDSNFANALKKLPSFFNRSNLIVTDDYREKFLKAEATFKHQYVYDPIERKMLRLTEPHSEDIETALCCNAGELLEPSTAFQLALGNLDPFTMKQMDNWDPDRKKDVALPRKSNSWAGAANHPSIWYKSFKEYLNEPCPWKKKVKKLEPIIKLPQTKLRNKVVNLVSKYVPETQDESLTIQNLSEMYCVEPTSKKPKTFDSQEHNNAMIEENDISTFLTKEKSPILENKDRSFTKTLKISKTLELKRLSRFPRTVLDNHVVESKFFNTPSLCDSLESGIEEDMSCKSDKSENHAQERNPFKLNDNSNLNHSNENEKIVVINSDSEEAELQGSQKENDSCNNTVKSTNKTYLVNKSPENRNPFRIQPSIRLEDLTEDSVIDNTYPMETLITPTASQSSFGESQPSISIGNNKWRQKEDPIRSSSQTANGFKKSSCRVPGLKRTQSLPNNQQTLLSKFGFQKRPLMKK